MRQCIVLKKLNGRVATLTKKTKTDVGLMSKTIHYENYNDALEACKIDEKKTTDVYKDQKPSYSILYVDKICKIRFEDGEMKI